MPQIYNPGKVVPNLQSTFICIQSTDSCMPKIYKPLIVVCPKLTIHSTKMFFSSPSPKYVWLPPFDDKF